jgi:dGTPase
MNSKHKGNRFYRDFDLETWPNPRRGDYRTPFQQDRARLVHSAAFRRLQGKTQVFLSGEYDFYRTRLTHSLEVAQVGRSICQWLLRGENSGGLLSDNFYIDSDLVEAICLAHDLGHPPFGHAGERQLHVLMFSHGGFEGNAQTLRLLTEIIYADQIRRTGMQPTRALMDGVMKYKTLLAEHPTAKNHYLYDEQKDCVDFIFANGSIPGTLQPRESLNAFRSIECQIMDWADNTAYCLSDIADAIQAGFINVSKIEKWAREQKLTSRESRSITNLINILRVGVVTRDLSIEIGNFVTGCRLRERQNFMSELTNRYRFELEIAPHVLEKYRILKLLAKDLVFRSPQIQQLEFKGNQMLTKLFEVLMENYLNSKEPQNLLPSSVEKLLRNKSTERKRIRLICDHIAGMTDGFALRTYRRLFDPSYGSIVDLV